MYGVPVSSIPPSVLVLQLLLAERGKSVAVLVAILFMKTSGGGNLLCVTKSITPVTDG